MFTWKPTFPQRPSPPSADEQLQDLTDCTLTDDIHSLIGGTDIYILPVDAIKPILNTDSITAGKNGQDASTPDAIQELRELASLHDSITKALPKLEENLSQLAETTKELENASHNVRQRLQTK